MLTLSRRELESHEDVKVCYICGIRFFKKRFRDKNYRKVRYYQMPLVRRHYTDTYRGAAHSI